VLLYKKEGGSYIWIGSAFFLTYYGFDHGKRTSAPRTYLVTAKHVAHLFGNDLYFSMPGGLIYHEPAASWLDHPQLDISLTDAKNMASLLGARVFKPGKINRDTRSVKVYFADQLREKYSTGALVDRKLTKRTRASYSTTSDQGGAGTSGSPVFAGDVCVGVHSGFDSVNKSNCFTPFLFLDIYAIVKNHTILYQHPPSDSTVKLDSANDNGALEAESVSNSFVSRDDLPDEWEDPESHGEVSEFDDDDYEDDGYGHMTRRGQIEAEARRFRSGVTNGASHYKKPAVKHLAYYESLRPYIDGYGYDYPPPADRQQLKDLLQMQLTSSKIRTNPERAGVLNTEISKFVRYFLPFNTHFDFIQNADPHQIMPILAELIEKWPKDASAALGSLTAKTVGQLTPDEKTTAIRYACHLICAWRKNDSDPSNKLMFFPFLKKELTKKDKIHRPRLVMLCNFAHNLAYHCVFKPVAEKFADDSKQTMTWYWPGKDPTYHRFVELMRYLKGSNDDRTIVNGDDCVSAKNFVVGGTPMRLMISTDMTSFDCMHSQTTVNLISALFGNHPVTKTAATNAIGPSIVGFGSDNLFTCDDYFLKSGSSVTTLFNSVTRNYLELCVLAQLEKVYPTIDALRNDYLKIFETTFGIKPKADLTISTTTYSINSHVVTENYEQEFKGKRWHKVIYPVFVEFERLPRMLATLAYQANGSDRNLAFELEREGFFSLLDVPPAVWPQVAKDFGPEIEPLDIIKSFGLPYITPNTEYIDERFVEDEDPFVNFKDAVFAPKPQPEKLVKQKPVISIGDMDAAQLAQFLADAEKIQLEKPVWHDIDGEEPKDRIKRAHEHLLAMKAYEKSNKVKIVPANVPEKSASPPKISPVAQPTHDSVGTHKRPGDLIPESREEKRQKQQPVSSRVDEKDAATALVNLKKRKQVALPAHLSLDPKVRTHAKKVPIVFPPSSKAADDYSYLDYLLNAYLFSDRQSDILDVLQSRYGKQIQGPLYKEIPEEMNKYRALCALRYAPASS
jgi:hypothetical protein